jgi:predicted component of type VI protein secretion system
MKLSLVVLNAGKSFGQTIPITKVPFLVGRDSSCHLRPASPQVSKRHCAILVKGGQVLVQDFGSTNGTFVNEVQVTGEAPLQKDDVLKMGPLTFRVLIEQTVLKTAPAVPASSRSSSTTTPAHGMPKLTKNPAAPQPAQVPGKSAFVGDADAAAAMILSDDARNDDTTSDVGNGLRASDIPSGTTEMNIPAMRSSDDTVAEKAPATAAAKPEEKKKITIGSAQDAAKAILEKMTRRR